MTRARTDPLPRVRTICLALPEAHEQEAWGEPTFRVRKKLFAMYASADNHHGRGRPGVWIKAKALTQHLLVVAHPDRFFVPPYVGPSGWVGVWLDRAVDWDELAELLANGYRLVAPKKLIATLDSAVVIIAPYDPRWPAAFESERERIGRTLGAIALRVDHHGSTSVPGLAAKPIIDIQISVDALRPFDAYAAGLAQLGYVHVPHADDARCPFFHRPAAWPHTHHVHVVEAGGEEERRTLAFRDYLREHADVAREYEALKRVLADRFTEAEFSSRQAYAEAKGEFVNDVTLRALHRSS